MRIAVDVRALTVPPTGTGIYTYNLLKEIAKLDRENEYWLCAHQPLFSEDLTQNTNFHLQINRAPLGILWQQLRLPRILTKFKIDLFHSPLFTLPFSPSCPSIVTVHDLVFKMFPHKHTLWNRTVTNILTKRAVKIACRIIVNSENTKRDLVNFLSVDEEKIKVTLLAAADVYHPIRDTQLLREVRKKYVRDEKFILYVGTLEPRKNLLSLIKSYNEFKKEVSHPPKLLLVGRQGWDYKSILKTISLFKKEIILTGYLPLKELVLLYNACEFFVYPSIYEGFGLPPLEAMACGKPVITSNTSSLPEVLGKAGIMVNPLNVEEIKEAMVKLWNSAKLREDKGIKSLERAKMFSWQKTAQATLKIYEEVFNENRN